MGSAEPNHLFTVGANGHSPLPLWGLVGHCQPYELGFIPAYRRSTFVYE
ncbi:hypothetical protein [[Phormidium] sp. ETS-05]|nr:hypothetical protein [[Phormidium] sp. ETS-05]